MGENIGSVQERHYYSQLGSKCILVLYIFQAALNKDGTRFERVTGSPDHEVMRLELPLNGAVPLIQNAKLCVYATQLLLIQLPTLTNNSTSTNMSPMFKHTALFWTGFLLALPGAFLAPTKRSDCTNPAIRREWSTLPQSQRDAFHKAVKCLQTKPSIVESNGGLAECGYTDPIPYWDWTRNANSVDEFKAAPIFDPNTGFGGPSAANNNGTAVCVDNGPYAGMQVNIPEPHCLQREFGLSSDLIGNWTSSNVNKFMEYPDYIRFWNNSEIGPHNNIHLAIGGDIFWQYSPNDPLFFLHHAQIDRLWTLWQGRNETRLTDYQGNTVQNSTEINASLQDTMKFLGLGEDRTVESLMDTLSNGLCYKYDDDE
ncbi:unnamed protein product [Rhizoctonia solani]|uniref:Tyrosinase copper-binding domain-containing protein n=1 Tax=Rhizoctonia solani TaxID=456999 RepID=A0A8H3GNE7_9AGAM|nr:unnamed protein product [Rhizoctonia solani]